MVFNHRKTGRPALYITTDGVPDKHVFAINEVSDMPEMDYSGILDNIPDEIWKIQGRTGVRSFFRAFLEYPDGTFYMQFFPSGYPEGELPPKNNNFKGN